MFGLVYFTTFITENNFNAFIITIIIHLRKHKPKRNEKR